MESVANLIPFLKYAGGKTQLIPDILNRVVSIKSPITTYVEPFIGSGSVLFALIRNKQITKDTKVIISDLNKSLIEMYLDIKESPDTLINLIDSYLIRFNPNKAKVYEELRAKYNKGAPRLEQSALFIFLNITCFNGLYRTNKSGEFNTPIGSNAKGGDAELTEQKRTSIRELSRVLNTYNITIKHCDYEVSITDVEQSENTLIYLDPPYYPVKSTSFGSYLGEFNHDEFFEFCRKLKCNVLVSNSDSIQVVIGLNHVGEDRHKFKIDRVTVRRMIGAKDRDKCLEILANNFEYTPRKKIEIKEEDIIALMEEIDRFFQ